MFIYKITNIQNDKVYIGQTIRPIEERFNRHMNDALHHIIDTKFCRAINKYGRESFKIELIDMATTQEELTNREYCWINFYNSCESGYNSTNDKNKCGGNTYQYVDNLDEIKEKLSKSKMGDKNPLSKKVKMFDLINNTEKIFGSMAGCARELNLDSHMPISRRCRGYTKSPLNGQYQFEYFVE